MLLRGSVSVPIIAKRATYRTAKFLTSLYEGSQRHNLAIRMLKQNPMPKAFKISFTKSLSTLNLGRMSYEQAVYAHEQLLLKISDDTHIQALKKLNSLNMDCMSKWQSLIGLIMPLQIKILSGLVGEDANPIYSPDQIGLMKYNTDMMLYVRSEESATLKKSSDVLWEFLFKVAFGITRKDLLSSPKLDAQAVRNMAITLANSIQVIFIITACLFLRA